MFRYLWRNDFVFGHYFDAVGDSGVLTVWENPSLRRVGRTMQRTSRLELAMWSEPSVRRSKAFMGIHILHQVCSASTRFYYIPSRNIFWSLISLAPNKVVLGVCMVFGCMSWKRNISIMIIRSFTFPPYFYFIPCFIVSSSGLAFEPLRVVEWYALYTLSALWAWLSHHQSRHFVRQFTDTRVVYWNWMKVRITLRKLEIMEVRNEWIYGVASYRFVGMGQAFRRRRHSLPWIYRDSLESPTSITMTVKFLNPCLSIKYTHQKVLHIRECQTSQCNFIMVRPQL